MTTALPARHAVPKEKLWDIDSVFPTLAAWEEAFAKLESSIPNSQRFRDRIGESATVLWEAMEWLIDTGQIGWRLSLYASMLKSGDAGDQSAAALGGRVGSLFAKFGAATAFYDPEILAISDDALDQFYEDEPALERYRHHFDRIRLCRAHTRSTEVEAILAQANEITSGPRTIFSALVNADLRFGEATAADGTRHPVQQGTIPTLSESPDRDLRKSAWEAYADGYLGAMNTMSAGLIQCFRGYLFRSRVRNYDTVLDLQMKPNAIPRAVFDNLLTAFRANLPIWHRFWPILRRALKLEVLHSYDVPIYATPAPQPREPRTISYEDAVAMICEGLAPLGGDYVNPMRRGLSTDRWVDAWPNQGKGSGAFSSGVYGTHPFIMMNFRHDLFSVSTLAHEIGHSMHSYLTWKHQPPVYSGYSLFVAEVASNFNQAMVRAHLLATSADRGLRMQVLEEAISNFHRYLFVMPTLAQFELDCYSRLERGEALNADLMSGSLVSLFREGYGGHVEIDEPRVGITWAQFGHLYAGYYVYQYATGIAAANALAQQVLAEGQPAAERYLEFLKAGGSLYPLDALKLAGVDMTSTKPVETAFEVLGGLIDQMDELVE